MQARLGQAAQEVQGRGYILTKDEGGRHTPFFTNYRPQFYFRTTDVTGVVHLPEGTEMVMPGDNVAMTVELITPIAMEEKLRFAIREGGRTGSGSGRVNPGLTRRRTADTAAVLWGPASSPPSSIDPDASRSWFRARRKARPFV